MKLLDQALTKFNRWLDQRAFRIERYVRRLDDLQDSGMSAEQAVESIEADIASGKTAWMPLPRKKKAAK